MLYLGYFILKVNLYVLRIIVVFRIMIEGICSNLVNLSQRETPICTFQSGETGHVSLMEKQGMSNNNFTFTFSLTTMSNLKLQLEI